MPFLLCHSFSSHTWKWGNEARSWRPDREAGGEKRGDGDCGWDEAEGSPRTLPPFPRGSGTVCTGLFQASRDRDSQTAGRRREGNVGAASGSQTQIPRSSELVLSLGRSFSTVK